MDYTIKKTDVALKPEIPNWL